MDVCPHPVQNILVCASPSPPLLSILCESLTGDSQHAQVKEVRVAARDLEPCTIKWKILTMFSQMQLASPCRHMKVG